MTAAAIVDDIGTGTTLTGVVGVTHAWPSMFLSVMALSNASQRLGS
jgi:hypothetical protein